MPPVSYLEKLCLIEDQELSRVFSGLYFGPSDLCGPRPWSSGEILGTPRVPTDSRKREWKLQLHCLGGRKEKSWAEIIKQRVEAKQQALRFITLGRGGREEGGRENQI